MFYIFKMWKKKFYNKLNEQLFMHHRITKGSFKNLTTTDTVDTGI